MNDRSLLEYVYYLNNKIDKYEDRIGTLERFKNEFQRKKSFVKKDFTFDLKVRLLADYYGKSYENMRLLKHKYLDSKDDKSQWALYCKSYYFDTKINK